MKLELKRRYRGPQYTIGTLYIDGERFCDTLEDTDRGLTSSMTNREIAERKVYGKTAIPTGTYTVNMRTVSPKLRNRHYARPYGGVLPRIIGIKGFTGVLIHPGNTPDDTDGCLLVGENKVKGKVINSTITFHRLMGVLLKADGKDEAITLEVS